MSENNWFNNAAMMGTAMIPGGAGVAAGMAGINYLSGEARSRYQDWRTNRQFSPERNRDILQRQFDGGADAYRRNDMSGIQQMQDAMTISSDMGVQLHTRGINMDQINARNPRPENALNNSANTAASNNQAVGAQVGAQAQANQLLDQHMMTATQMANQQSQAASQVPGVVDMNLRNDDEARGRRELAFNQQLQMQGQRFMADLEHSQALRARPLNRDVSHQENDAQLASIAAQNRGQMATALINMYGQIATNRAGMYRA